MTARTAPRKSFYGRIFGSGPAIALGGCLGLALAWAIAAATPNLAFGIPAPVRLAVFAAAIVLAAALIVWSLVVLSPERRGNELVTEGPFHWLRHPLYAAFLSIIAPALVVLLDHPAYLLSVAIAHLLANALIGYEERQMQQWFPADYEPYCARTGRFLPRFARR